MQSKLLWSTGDRPNNNYCSYVLEVTKICIADVQIVFQRPVVTFADERKHYTASVE